jgi:hypothetical protein
MEGSTRRRWSGAQPRRRITVDELVALARVFEVPVNDLLTDPKLLAFKTVVPLLDEWRETLQRRARMAQESDAQMQSLREEIRTIAAQSPEAEAVVGRYFEIWAEDTGQGDATWADHMTRTFLAAAESD